MSDETWEPRSEYDPEVEFNVGDLYHPCASCKTQEQADSHFEALVRYHMASNDLGRQRAESAVKQNIGYWAGYFGRETAARMHRLFRCAHPIFGRFEEGDGNWPTPGEAIGAGRAAGGEERP